MLDSIPKQVNTSNKIVTIQGIKTPDVSKKLTIIDQYIQDGCVILALRPGDNRPEWEFTDDGTSSKTTDIAEVARWYARKPNINIGKYLPDNRFALDIDVKVNKKGAAAKGVESLAKLEASLGQLPRTRKTQTPSGGYHLEFLLPENTGIVGRNNFAAGIDSRCGEGYYLAVPPSIRSHGSYVVVDDVACAELPEAWVAYLQEHTHATTASKRDGDSASTWLADKNKAFAESHPLHISPIAVYVTCKSVRDVAIESGLWEEVVGSHKLISATSGTGHPGFMVIETDEGIDLARDHHELLNKAGAPTYMNALQLRKYIILNEDIDPFSDEKIIGITEEEAFEQVMKEARALMPSDYTLFPGAPKGKTVAELNTIADKTGIHAIDLHDSAWFLEQVDKLPAGDAKAQAGRDLLTLLAKYHRVFDKPTHALILDKLVKTKAITASDAKAVTKAAVSEHRLLMGMSKLDAMVEEMNLTHYNAMVGGKNVIITLEDREEMLDGSVSIDHYVEYSSAKELRNIYLNKPRYTFEDPNSGEVKAFNQLDAWMLHAKSNTCPKGVCFVPHAPNAQKYTPEGQLNLFQGWSSAPVEGDWSVVANHYREVLCNGDEAAYEYLLNWMARFVQQPDRQGRVIPVFQGEKRTGKGIGIEFLVRLVGRHAITLADPKRLLGSFNGHLEDKVLVFADEGLFVGDHAAMDKLKALATEPRMMVEHKFMAARSVPNRLKMMMATNSDWVVPATKDEVRFFVNRVSSHRIGDNNYFKTLFAAINDKAVQAAFLYDMCHRDITSFNVEDIPRTEALEHQIRYTMDPIWQWWSDCLRRGFSLNTQDAFNESEPEWQSAVHASALFDEFTKWCDTQRIQGYHRLTQTAFGTLFHKLYVKRKAGKARCAHYMVGTHAEALKVFAAFHKISGETIMGVDDDDEDFDLLS